jgi:hypothetical protein
MLFCHLGLKVAPENSLGSTGKPWNQILYLRICITGLILFLDISREERYISSQISAISLSPPSNVVISITVTIQHKHVYG